MLMLGKYYFMFFIDNEKMTLISKKYADIVKVISTSKTRNVIFVQICAVIVISYWMQIFPKTV